MCSCPDPFGLSRESNTSPFSLRKKDPQKGHVALEPWDLTLTGTVSIRGHVAFLLVCLPPWRSDLAM